MMELLSSARIPYIWQLPILWAGEYTKDGKAKYFVTDFELLAPPDDNILIEIDGEAHNGNEEYDAKRDRYLQSRGYRVMHFTNRMVLRDGRKVIEAIQTELRRVK